MNEPAARSVPSLEIGWYGKLPAAGDFLSRRLPADFVQAWDQWLQMGIAHSRSVLGERWQELYLTFPVWRFLLPADELGAPSWCGVLMPSVDRVGRLFPLTVCRPLTADVLASLDFTTLEGHLARIDAAGVRGLDAASVEHFEKQLESVQALSAGEPTRTVPLGVFAAEYIVGSWALPGPLEATLARSAAQMMLTHLGRRVLWWLPADDGNAGTIRLEHSPLRAELFTSLITNE